MEIKLKEISRDDLKVGDTVGIAREVFYGWRVEFRHKLIIPAKIVKITPKRTKIVTYQFGEHEKYERFYEYDDNAKKENELAEKFVQLRNLDGKLTKFKSMYGLSRITDEDIIEMSEHVEKILEILDRYRK